MSELPMIEHYEQKTENIDIMSITGTYRPALYVNCNLIHI